MSYNRIHMSAVDSLLDWAKDQGKQRYNAAKCELTQLLPNNNLYSWMEFYPDAEDKAKEFAAMLNGTGFEATVVRAKSEKYTERFKVFPAVRFRVGESRIHEG